MDWVFAVYGSMFFIGLVLCILKLFYMSQKKIRGYMNLCIQYSTGSSVFMLLIGTLGIISARLSNATGEVGVEIFLFAFIVYMITTSTFCFLAIGFEIRTSLLRKGRTKLLLRICLGIIIISPICTSGAAVGLGAKHGQLIGSQALSITVFIAVFLSSIFLVSIFCKAKVLANAISPIFEQQGDGADALTVAFSKNADDILPGPSTDQRNEGNNNKVFARQSLKSNLKKKGSVKEATPRTVCFLIGREMEIWHREKEVRRIEKERNKALLFLILLLCYGVCFMPFCFVLLYHGTFSIRILACRVAYISAALFAIIEPIAYVLYIDAQASNA